LQCHVDFKKRAILPIFLLTTGLGLLLLVLFGRLPGDALWAGPVMDAAHGPVFALIALIVLQLRKRSAGAGDGRFRPWPGGGPDLAYECVLAFAVTALLGALIEVLQRFVDRDSSVADIATDCLGAVCGIGIHLFLSGAVPADRGRASAAAPAGVRHSHDAEHSGLAVPQRRVLRWGALAAACAAMGIVLAPPVAAGLAYALRDARFPVLMDADTFLGDYFVRLFDVEGVRALLPPAWRTPEHAPERRHGLRIDMDPAGRWGVALYEPLADWRGKRALRLELINPGDQPLKLRVRLFDRHHRTNRRYGYLHWLEIPPATRVLESIALPPPAGAPGQQPMDPSALDLSAMAGLVISSGAVRAAPGSLIEAGARNESASPASAAASSRAAVSRADERRSRFYLLDMHLE